MPPEYYLLLITIFTTLVPSTNAADKYAPILAKAVNTRDLILNGKCKTGDMVELTKPFKSILKPEKYDSCIVDSAVGTRVSYEDFTGFSSSDVNQKIGAGLGVGVDAGVVSAKVKVDVDKSAREQETHTSATKIITLEVGTISLDQQCLQSRDFLDPQFVKDFTSLPTTNLMSLPDSTFPEWQSYIKFLSSWGTAYTTAVSKGGNVRIDIQTNDKITTTTTTVTVTIEVSVLWFHFSSSATHTDVDTKEKRDATVDLSVTGGSDGAKKAMMDRLQQIRDSFKSGSPPPDGNKNMTQDWVNSVSKEKFAQLTNGQFSTWDKFPMQFLFKTPEEQARVKSNFQIITSQYLNSHFAAPCSPQRFNFFTKTCEGVNAVKDALKYNIKVNLRTPDGEYFDRQTGQFEVNGKTCRLNDSEFMFTSNGNNLFSMELDGFAIQLDDGAVSRVTDGGNSRNIRNVSINGDGVKRFANIVDGLNNRNHKIARRDVSGLKNSTNHIQAAAKRALKFKLVTKSNPNLLTNVTMNPNNMIIFAGKTTAENRYLRFKSGKSRSSRETGGGRSSFQVVSTYPRSTEEYNSAYYFDLIPSKKSGQRIIQSARAIQDLGSNSTIKMRMIAFGPRGYITVDGRTSNLAVTTDGDNGAKNTALLWTRTKNPKKRGMMQLGLGSLGVFQFDGDHNSIQYHNATSNDEATLWKQIIRSYNDPSKGPIDVVQLSPLRSAAPKCIYLTSEDGFHLDKCDLEDESDRKFSYIEMIG